MNVNDNELLAKKAYFFKNNEIAVHITKKDGWFHNGKIIDVTTDFIILIDEKDGDIPIFFIEILKIEKREKKGD